MSTPFEFAAAAELVEITGRQARNLDQLHALLRAAEPAAIFHHTYQTLREHHFLLERYPNDFADWSTPPAASRRSPSGWPGSTSARTGRFVPCKRSSCGSSRHI